MSFPFVNDVLKMCKSILVTVIDGEAGETIKLAHFSVKEFLILQESSNKSAQWYKFTTNLAHRYITARLLDCLFDDAKSPHSLALHEYAQSYWPAHSKERNTSTEWASVCSKIDTYFSEEARKRLLRLVVCSRAQILRSRQYGNNELTYPSALVALKPTVLESWKEGGPSDRIRVSNDVLSASNEKIDVWLANRCDKIVDALDLLLIMEDMGHHVPTTLYALLQIGLHGIDTFDPGWTASSSWVGIPDLQYLEMGSRNLALFSEGLTTHVGQELLDALVQTAVDLPDPPHKGLVVTSRLLSAFITLLDRWQPQLHYENLLLSLLVSSRRTQSHLDKLLFHIKLATIDENLIGVVALTPCAYEVTRFFLSAVNSDPAVIEDAAPEIYRLLYFWATSESHGSVLRDFLRLAAFDCHPSVTEFGTLLRQGRFGIPRQTFTSPDEIKVQTFNASNTSARSKIMSLLIDHLEAVKPIQESVVSLIAEFFELQVFSALLYKLWDKVPITRRVLQAVVRNKQINWPSFQRLILGLNAAGFPLSDDIASFIANDCAYDQLMWPINQSLADQGGPSSSHPHFHDVFLDDSEETVRFGSGPRRRRAALLWSSKVS